MENVCDASQVTQKKKNKMVERSNEGEGGCTIRNSQEKFGAKLSGPTVGGNDDEAYKTTRAERGRQRERRQCQRKREKTRECETDQHSCWDLQQSRGPPPYLLLLGFFFPSLAIRNLSLSAPHPQLFFKTLR
jgi:hypothetical protein